MSDQSLCTACGMCCDGTLFGHVRLASEEVATAADAGLAIVPVKGGAGFLQPCPQLRCGECAIYDRRPSPCRRYRCTTLIALEAGEIDGIAAGRRVEAAKGAIARLRHNRPDQSLSAIRTQLCVSEKASNSGHLVVLAALELILDRHFRRKDQQVLKPDQAATAASP